MVVDVKLKTCRKVNNAVSGSWKGGVVMPGGAAPPAGCRESGVGPL